MKKVDFKTKKIKIGRVITPSVFFPILLILATVAILASFHQPSSPLPHAFFPRIAWLL
jgi:hypothetical protein